MTEDAASTFCWDLEFHGCRYEVCLKSNDNVLSLELEQYDNCERWSAQFTAEHVESMTKTAGNVKKFSVFVKMLVSAFAKENSSVFVDILTYGDLEVLKAKKTGNANTSTSSAHSNAKAQSRRYVILTYSGEFDRVHYPLTLEFEETPNVSSLQATIRRLRKQALESSVGEILPASEREKELRQQVSLLRQENTELKHRLRQAESRNGKSPNAANPPSPVLAELTNANNKLRKEIEQLRKEQEEQSYAAAREVEKWKMMASSSLKGSRSGNGGVDGSENVDLRRRITALEKELRQARGLRDASPATGRYSHTYALSTAASRAQGVGGARPADRTASQRYVSPTSRSYAATDRQTAGPHYAQPRSRETSPALRGREKTSQRRAWGSNSPNRESGYASATSQSSAGSRRSSKSVRSTSTAASSRGSKHDQPTRTHRKSSSHDQTGNGSSKQKKRSKELRQKRGSSPMGVSEGIASRKTVAKQLAASTPYHFSDDDAPPISPREFVKQTKRRSPSRREGKSSVSASATSLILSGEDPPLPSRVLTSWGSDPPSSSYSRPERSAPAAPSDAVKPSASLLRVSTESSKSQPSRSVGNDPVPMGSSRPIETNPAAGEDEISDIDKRILALQQYLDNARVSIIADNVS